ncbi:MAG TPA: hypothetical protein VGB37_01125 [Candidatus Lokiarchaeia archaeon]
MNKEYLEMIYQGIGGSLAGTLLIYSRAYKSLFLAGLCCIVMVGGLMILFYRILNKAEGKHRNIYKY